MRLTPKYYAQAWFAALSESKPEDWSTISQRVLQHVYKHGNVKWLPEIVRLVSALQHKQAGTVPVTVRTARSLDAALLKQLVSAVLPTANTVIEQQVDTRVIGGAQIETTDQRWDLSIQGQLNQLAHTLR